jgi:hypothetical protein
MLTGDAILSRRLARNAHLRHQAPGSPSPGTPRSSQNTRPTARMGFALDVPLLGCLAGAKAPLCNCGETVEPETALTGADAFTTTICVQGSFGLAHTAGTARFLGRVAGCATWDGRPALRARVEPGRRARVRTAWPSARVAPSARASRRRYRHGDGLSTGRKTARWRSPAEPWRRPYRSVPTCHGSPAGPLRAVSRRTPRWPAGLARAPKENPMRIEASYFQDFNSCLRCSAF